VALVALLALTDAARSFTSLLLFTFAAFTITAVVSEYWRGARARKLMSSDSYPLALVSMVRRNRRRYGGYAVHAGIAVVLLGVAASSAFNTQRDVRLAPGQSARVGGYAVRYLRPTAGVSDERINFGAVLSIRKGGKQVALLRPSRSYFPGQDSSMGVIGRFFRGESTSEVGLSTGLKRDLWTAMQPDLRFLNRSIREGNRVFADLPPRAQAIAIVALTRSYLDHAPPATFRVIVNPMVSWIWIGGVIVLGGALVALWPSALAARRRITSVYAARLGRELSRA
jgi:cytochrome c-type biogenesis protein CcmF